MPGDAAVARRDSTSRSAILVEHVQPFEQRPCRAPQHVGHRRRRHPRRQDQREIALHRWLQRQRTVRCQLHASDQQPDLEPEERRRPDRRIGLEGTCLPHDLPSPLRRHPTNRPTRCRLHDARGGRDVHR